MAVQRRIGYTRHAQRWKKTSETGGRQYRQSEVPTFLHRVYKVHNYEYPGIYCMLLVTVGLNYFFDYTNKLIDLNRSPFLISFSLLTVDFVRLLEETDNHNHF
jgi:hypothetical protein